MVGHAVESTLCSLFDEHQIAYNLKMPVHRFGVAAESAD